MLETGLIGRLARPVSLCVGVAFESEFQSLACFHTKVKNSQRREVRKLNKREADVERSGRVLRSSTENEDNAYIHKDHKDLN